MQEKTNKNNQRLLMAILGEYLAPRKYTSKFFEREQMGAEGMVKLTTWNNFGTTYHSISTNLRPQDVGESSPQISPDFQPQAESEQKKVVDQVSETAGF